MRPGSGQTGAPAVSLDMAWFQGDGAIEARERLSGPFELEHDMAAIAVRFRETRRQKDGAIEARQGLVGALQVAQGVAAVIVDARIGGRQGDGAIEARERLLGTAQSAQRNAAIRVSSNEIGCEGGGMIEACDGICVAPQLEKQLAAKLMGLGRAGSKREVTIDTRQSLGRSPERGQDHALVQMKLRRARISFERRCQDVVRLLSPAGPRFREGQKPRSFDRGRAVDATTTILTSS